MTTANLTAIAAAANVGAVAFVDTVTALSIIREAGDSYAAAGGVFFKTAAAAWLFLGDADARSAARTIWADSKDKSREYFLKVCRACHAAAAAGKAEGIREVVTFAQLAALGKVTDDKKEEVSAPTQQDAARKAAELFAAASKASGEVSRLNKATNALETLTAQAALLRNHAPAAGEADAIQLSAAMADADAFKKATKAEMAAALRELVAAVLARDVVMADAAVTIEHQVSAIDASMRGVEQPAEQVAEQPAPPAVAEPLAA